MTPAAASRPGGSGDLEDGGTAVRAHDVDRRHTGSAVEPPAWGEAPGFAHRAQVGGEVGHVPRQVPVGQLPASSRLVEGVSDHEGGGPVGGHGVRLLSDTVPTAAAAGWMSRCLPS
ncbi:hypothetical protein GCM10009867_04430 [Pedococcus aerophilus]|uniref:Uncharacterized protein n=1 Tax=Pedococcus aerophilus TaxID=436356 RepID=A0ABN3UEF5_9MICO